MNESVFRRPVHQNDYGRTLLDGTREIFCQACGGWCDAQSCNCSDCRSALEEYRESRMSEDTV